MASEHTVAAALLESGSASAPALGTLVSLVAPGLGYMLLFSGPLDGCLLVFFSLLWEPARVGFLTLSQAAKVAAASAIAFFVFQLLRSTCMTLAGPKWDGPGKVLLFPSRTYHGRMFPKKHSFSYSYLVVGVPVGWKGTAGGMVSTGVRSESGWSSWFSLAPQARKGWFDVDAGDYLQRGHAKLGLRGKLDGYLRSQNIDPATYPHAYLVTAARFLGYHFNPVSFWYLYDANKSLAAMILEVNNTFGERRMYFLTPNDDAGDAIEGASTRKGDGATKAEAKSPRSVIKQKWHKDFHVSPFNSRKGSYSLNATDPLGPYMQGSGLINNTINLVSSKGHGKLVANLVAAGNPLDPYQLSTLEKVKFLLSWWWVGFVTYPRIVKEAGMLFFRRKLHVWFRPEPLRENIGRLADSIESQLEPIFRRYLRHLVTRSTVPLSVKYIPSGIAEGVDELILSPSAAKDSREVEHLELKVLTPVFYARFVHYAHDLEAFFCELNESCTIWVSRPDLLPKFALKRLEPTLRVGDLIDFTWFKIIQRLRVRPERIKRPLTSSAVPAPAEETSSVDIRRFRISSMDNYVLTHEPHHGKAIYRRCVLKLFLAHRVAWGFLPILEVQRFLLQVCCAWLLSSGFQVLVGQIILSR